MENLEREIQTSLFTLLDEYYRQTRTSPIITEPAVPEPVPPTPPMEEVPSIGTITEEGILQTLRLTMEDYNNNMRLFLQIMNEISRRPTYHSGRSQRAASQLYTYYYYPLTPVREPSINLHQDVIVRPTEREILNATNLVNYETEGEWINTSCPITLDIFEDGEVVCQILHCRHIFRENAIKNWFQTNVRCPVCRYDIRTYNREWVSSSSSSTGPLPSRSAQRTNTTMNELTNIIENAINDENHISRALYRIMDMSGYTMEMDGYV